MKVVERVDLGEALRNFFTSTVPLPACPVGLSLRSIWWERRGGWLYPWRVVEYVDGIAQGYPCGEPRRDD